MQNPNFKLDDLSIDELVQLVEKAKKQLVILQRQGARVRDAFEKKAREAGLSIEEAEILFGK